MSKKKEGKDQPIQKVSRITGLTPHVIRIWEKRYQAVSPERTGSNRRRYTEEDIERLQLLGYLTREGHRISQVARLAVPDLKELVQSLEKDRKSEDKTEGSAKELMQNCLSAVERLEAQELEVALARATIFLNPVTVIETLVMPVLEEIGRRRRQGKLRLFHERFAYANMRPFLLNFMKSYEVPPHAPRLISTTPTGQLQEFGALYLMSAAAATGWRATYLGFNLPYEEIAAAAHQLSVKLVSLNISQPQEDPMLLNELRSLRKLLAPETKILVVGASTPAYKGVLDQLGMMHVSNFPALLASLENLREELSPSSIF